MSTGAELTTQVRDYTRDRVQPYKLSDPFIIGQLADGISTLCKQTHVLIDPAVPLTLAADVNLVAQASNVLQVYAARIVGDNQVLSQHRGPAAALHVHAASDKPRVWSTNLGPGRILFWPTPDEEYEVEMICAVKPTARITSATDSGLEEDDEAAVVKYALSQCLLVHDIDGLNPGAGSELFEVWRRYVINLRQEIYRYRTGDRMVIEYWAGLPKSNGAIATS